MNFKKILNCRRKTRLGATTTNFATTVTATATSYDFLNCQHLHKSIFLSIYENEA